MKVFLKIMSIILIVLGALSIIGSVFMGLGAEIISTLFGTTGTVLVICTCVSSVVTFVTGICGCNYRKIPKACYVLGLILGIISLVIIGLNIFAFGATIGNVILLIVDFVLAVLYLIPVIVLKRRGY